MCNCQQTAMGSDHELIPELEEYLDGKYHRRRRRRPPEVQYEVIESDERMPVPDSSWAPFRYICQITARLSKLGVSSVGTGFFIGPRTILTAAHVIWDPFLGPNGGKPPAANVEIVPARNGETKPFGTVQASEIVVSYPDFKSGDMGKYKDYAILHIAEPKGMETGYFGRGVWAKDSIGSTDLRKSFCFPCPIECQSLGVAGYPYDLDKPKATKLYKSSDVALRQDGKFLLIRNDTYKSMSGCPVWMRRDPRNGGRTVVGLLLGAGDPTRDGKYLFNVARNIDDEVRKFISDNYR